MFAIKNISAVIDVYGGALPVAFIMAITFAVFGVFVVLKRMVFIGVTLSEVAACGVAFALTHQLPPFLGAAFFCLGVIAILSYPYEHSNLPRDTVLGSIFILASGMSILIVARSGLGLEKVKGILYGNLLFASSNDVLIIFAVMTSALFTLLVFFRPVLYSFLDRESAISLGINAWRFELLFFILLGLTVASASRIAGVMLVFCYLVVPAATALLLSRDLLYGILLACSTSILATVLGIMTSYQADLPPNQLIAVISCCFLGIAFLYNSAKKHWGLFRAIAISAIPALALMWQLKVLDIPMALVDSSAYRLSTEKNDAAVAQEDLHGASMLSAENPFLNEASSNKLNWLKIVEDIEHTASSDKSAGKCAAIAALKLNPPDFFAEQLKTIIGDAEPK